MIVWKGRGNLLTQRDHVQMCTVNAVGTMGRGLAKTMARAYPEVEVIYRQLYSQFGSGLNMADRARVLTMVETPDNPTVLLFCTKLHWRQPSPMILVRDNLRQLAERWKTLGIDRLAMPLPGTGLGGLPIEEVTAMVEHYLGATCALPVRLYVGT